MSFHCTRYGLGQLWHFTKFNDQNRQCVVTLSAEILADHPPDDRAQAFSRVLACTRSSRDAWLRKSHAASRRLALGLPSSRCGVCCPRAALASMHAPRPGCPALLPAPQAGFPTLRSGRACWSQSLRVRGTFVPFSTQFLVELSVGSSPLSVCICYTSFALVAEILRKGGGAFDAIPMDHFYTMRDLQEWVARH